MSIDLAPHVLERVRTILRAHVRDCEVWAFGSRVDGPSKPFSDLDLAVVSATELPTRRLALLAYAFEESDLPIKVDLIDWQSASPAFRQRIAAHHAIIERPEPTR
ncbi:nucleotidyltransferase domain-containing protein [bacterium]|nr:nucleotidyltransferase domain-containing protein [bacterium]